MLNDELTGRILHACFDVSNELGPGFLESVYEQALAAELTDSGLSVARQVPLTVHYRNHIVGQFFADLLVEGRVLVELKAVRTLAAEHTAQILNYLKATGIETGLLVNFGVAKIEYRRFCNRVMTIATGEPDLPVENETAFTGMKGTKADKC